MKYLLGIDFGGGASKATLLSEEGKIVATNTVEYPTLYPQSGWTEQDPDDWYRATKENIAAVLQKSGVDPKEILALSLDAATHTAVLMDEDFRVLMPSIYWTDIRSVKEASELRESYAELIRNQAYHTPDTIWTLPQLMWVKNNRPDVWARTKRILFAKDYVRHKLTGDYVTDYIEAEGSMLFDFDKQCWSEELCSLIGFDPKELPRIVSPTDLVGYVTPEAAADTGLSISTAVLCGTTDTVMEVFAAGAVEEGQMTLKLATAGRICIITDRAYKSRHLVTYSHVLPSLWYPGTATKSCAASYRWYRDTFGGDYGELDEGAANVAPGADGLIFSPYLNGELTPYADPLLCASFIGVRAGHTKAHFTRAVLEGVAMSLLDCKNALESLSIPHEDAAVVIGGGSKSPLWRQIVADVLGIELIKKNNSDSSLGSAMMAGVSAGLFSSYGDAIKKCTKEEGRTLPNEENRKIYERLYEKYKAVHDALEDVYRKYSAI